MLCPSCRASIAERLGPDDYLVLDTLQQKRAVSGACGLSREDILAMCEAPLTVARLRDALIRLTAVGFIQIANVPRRGLIYITPDGETALAEFKSKVGGRR